MNAARMKPVLLGACFFVSLIFILALSYKSDNFQPSADEYRLTAVFGNVSGLRVGARVLMQGVDIGRVAVLDFDPENFTVAVTVNIKKGVPIPLDSFVSIQSSGFFGDKFMAIFPGGDEEILVAGESFDFTQDSIEFLDVMARILNAAERAIEKKDEGA